MNIQEILNEINAKLEAASEKVYLSSLNSKSNGMVVLSDVKEDLKGIIVKIDNLEDSFYGGVCHES